MSRTKMSNYVFRFLLSLRRLGIKIKFLAFDMYIYIFNFTIKYFDVCLFQLHFQLHNLQYEILQKSNHLQELCDINIFPLDILNHGRNR